METGTLRNPHEGAPLASYRSVARNERRRVRRFAIDAVVRIDGETALAIDLSRDGVFFESERAFDPGELVELVLPYDQAAHGRSVACSARIVRVESRGEFYGVAALFEPLSGTMPA